MELQAGDRITHPAMPAWGLGQVIGSPAGNTVRVFFVGAGEKVISLDHVTLVRVTGIEAANALLDYLRVDDSGTVIRYRSLPDSIAYFLKEYPGGFYGEKFLTQEREYKIAAHRLTRELLAKSDSHRLLSRDIDEFIQRALRVVNATNLIFPNEKMSLRDGLGEASHRRSFAQALFELLHGTQPLEHRFTKFAEVLGTIGAGKWTIASYFSFLYSPSDYVFLKPAVTQHAAQVCAFEIHYRSELNFRTYERVQAFARYLMESTAEIKPRDMIDIQSFMWCIAPE